MRYTLIIPSEEAIPTLSATDRVFPLEPILWPPLSVLRRPRPSSPWPGLLHPTDTPVLIPENHTVGWEINLDAFNPLVYPGLTYRSPNSDLDASIIQSLQRNPAFRIPLNPYFSFLFLLREWCRVISCDARKRQQVLEALPLHPDGEDPRLFFIFVRVPGAVPAAAVSTHAHSQIMQV
jgi:hypothetical protein